MPRSSSVAISSSLLLLAACGDPLVGADYQGEPLLVLTGQVIIAEEIKEPEGEIRVAIHWSSVGDQDWEHQAATTVETSFPASYTLTLYTPPPESVLYRAAHGGAPMAVGVPIVFDDVDSDRGYGVGEPVLGGSEEVLLLWAQQEEQPSPPPEGGEGGPDDTGMGPGPGPGEEQPQGEPLAPGYHAVSALGQSCDTDHLVLREVDSGEVTLTLGSS